MALHCFWIGRMTHTTYVLLFFFSQCVTIADGDVPWPMAMWNPYFGGMCNITSQCLAGCAAKPAMCLTFTRVVDPPTTQLYDVGTFPRPF